MPNHRSKVLPPIKVGIPMPHAPCLPPSAGVSGQLEIGTNGCGEVVINHPDLKPDADGTGHIVFSPHQARALARILAKKAKEADVERQRLGYASMH
jgi:hypothetical protein